MNANGSEIPPDQGVLIEKGELPFNALSLVAVLLRASFVYFLPAAVVTRLLPNNALTIALAIAAYAVLIRDAVHRTVSRVIVIYNPQVKYEPVVRRRLTQAEWIALAKRSVTMDLIISYLELAYIFALAHTLVSRLNANAFNIHVGLGNAFYFSVTTLATVGYGDIVPVSPLARALAVTEILLGLIYVVLVLSVIASYLQARGD